MKKRLAFILLVAAAVIAPVVSYAIAPQLKRLQEEFNRKCPMKIDEDSYYLKIVFPDDKTCEVHMTDAVLDELDENYTSDAEDIEAFHEGYMGSLTSDNVFAKLAMEYRLNLVYVLYNSARQRKFSDTFTLAEITRALSPNSTTNRPGTTSNRTTNTPTNSTTNRSTGTTTNTTPKRTTNTPTNRTTPQQTPQKQTTQQGAPKQTPKQTPQQTDNRPFTATVTNPKYVVREPGTNYVFPLQMFYEVVNSRPMMRYDYLYVQNADTYELYKSPTTGKPYIAMTDSNEPLLTFIVEDEDMPAASPTRPLRLKFWIFMNTPGSEKWIGEFSTPVYSWDGKYLRRQ